MLGPLSWHELIAGLLSLVALTGIIVLTALGQPIPIELQHAILPAIVYFLGHYQGRNGSRPPPANGQAQPPPGP